LITPRSAPSKSGLAIEGYGGKRKQVLIVTCCSQGVLLSSGHHQDFIVVPTMSAFGSRFYLSGTMKSIGNHLPSGL
jgi:hypothetical protein